MKYAAVISSVKPFKDDAYTAYQKAAIASWLPVCHNVVLFNDRADVGDITPILLSRPDSNPPTIKSMLEVVSERIGHEGVVIICNSDIVLDPHIMRAGDVADEKRLGRAWAATSFRYEGNPPEIKGNGLDVFILTGTVITHILKDIPPYITIGRVMWDAWLNGWLRRNLKESNYFDITPWRVVHHPEHDRPNGVGGDHSPYTPEQANAIMSHGHLNCGGIPLITYT